MKLNAYLLKSTVVAALGGLLFGFDTAVISGTTSALASTYHLSPTLLGVTVASALYGTILGAMLAGWPGERYGRASVMAGATVSGVWRSCIWFPPWDARRRGTGLHWWSFVS